MHNFSFLYIASNQSLEGIVKIGFTRRNPSERMLELDTTGVPTPFDISFVACLEDAKNLESLVHQYLADCRIRNEREFFKINLREAINAVMAVVDINNIEIFFHKTDENAENITNLVTAVELNQNDFEADFYESLVTFDYKNILKKWKLYVGYESVSGYGGYASEVNAKYKFHLFSYFEKIKDIGNEELDELFLKELPKVFRNVELENYIDIFNFAKNIFKIQKSSENIALEFLKKSSTEDTMIDAAILLYRVGLDDECSRILNLNLTSYFNQISFNRRFHWSDINQPNWQAADILFIVTALNMKEENFNDGNLKNIYMEFAKQFFENTVILNNEVEKNKFLLSKKQYYEDILKVKSSEEDFLWFKLANKAKIAFLEPTSISYIEYKQLLDEHLNYFFIYESITE